MFLLIKTAYVLPAFSRIFLPALLFLIIIFIMPVSVLVTAILLAFLTLFVVISTCPMYILAGVFPLVLVIPLMTTLLNCVMISTLFSIYVYPPILAVTFLISFCATLIAQPYSSFEVCAPFSYTCDHSIISFRIQFSSTSRKHVHMPNFKSANYTAICDELSCQEWDAVVSCCNNDVQLLYDTIIDKVKFIHLSPCST